MWYPKNTVFSTENFSSQNTGQYSYTNFRSQNNIGGYVSLRNIATGNNVIVPAGEPWPAISWDRVFNLGYNWSANSGSLFTVGGTPSSNLAANTTILTGGTTLGHNFVFAHENGWLAEFGCKINRLTGTLTNVNNGYGFVSQDENDQDSDALCVVSVPIPGIYINYNGAGSVGGFMPVPDITNRVVKFRCSRYGDTLSLLCDNGQALYLTGSGPPFTDLHNNAGTGGFSIGFLGNQAGGVPEPLSNIEFSHLYIKSPSYDVNGDFIADTLYSTTSQTVSTPVYTPNIPISKFTSAVIGLAGNTGGGTTTVVAYYNTGSGFVSGASSTYGINTNTGLYSFDLSSIPVNGNGTDQIRFDIRQVSTNGHKPPIAVEYITVCYDVNNSSNLLYLYPEYGSSDGQYAITVGIDPTSKDHIRPPKIDQYTIFYAPLTGSSLVDIVNRNTGATSVDGSSGNSFNITGFFSDNPRKFHSTSIVSTLITGIFPSGGYNNQPSENIHYRVRYSGNNEFLASKDFEYLYPANFSGVSTGTGGLSLGFYSKVALNNNDTFQYSVSPIQFSNNGVQTWYMAQNYYGNQGYGFSTPNITTGFLSNAQYIVLDAIVESNRFDIVSEIIGLNGIYGSSKCIYPAEKIGNRQRIRNVYPVDKTGNIYISFYGSGDQGLGAWSVSDISLSRGYFSPVNMTGYNNINSNLNYVFSPGSPAFSTTYSNTGIIIDAWVYPEGFFASEGLVTGSRNTIVKLNGSHPAGTGFYKLSINNDGSPVYSLQVERPGAGTTTYYSVTGNNRLEPNKWNHIAGGSRRIGPREHFVMLNGEISNSIRGSFDLVDTNLFSGYSVEIGNNFIGAIEHPRIRVRPNINSVAPFDAFSASPKFRSEYQWKANDTVSMFRLDNGGLLDYGPNNNYIYIPKTGNNEHYVERSVEGIFGEALGLVGDVGHAKSVFSLSNTGRVATISTYLAVNTDVEANCNIFTIGTTSLKVSNGKLLYVYSGSQLTGSTNIVTGFSMAPVTIHHNYVPGDGCFITGYRAYNIEFTGLVPGTTWPRFQNELHLGHLGTVDDYGDIYLDEFCILTGLYTGNEIFDYRVAKTKPNETVYFNDTAINTGNIKHISVYEKQIIIPPRTDYTSTGVFNRLKVNTIYGDLNFNQVFSYMGARYVVPDTATSQSITDISTKLCKTKSPFRIGSVVPKDAVNLAFITTQPVSIDSNLSLLDYANNIPENIINSLKSYSLMSGTTQNQASGSTYVINRTGDLNASNIDITSYAIIRNDTNTISAPLFYHDKLGPDNIYLYVPSSSNTASGSHELIRSSIDIIDQEGSTIPIDEYPWDIRVSKYTKSNIVLPTGVFYVDLLTRDKYIEGKSVFARFNAVNSLNGYSQSIGYVHLVNPLPIYRQLNSESPITGETMYIKDLTSFYDIDSNNNSMYSMNINLRSGQWHPGIHNNYYYSSEFIND